MKGILYSLDDPNLDRGNSLHKLGAIVQRLDISVVSKNQRGTCKGFLVLD